MASNGKKLVEDFYTSDFYRSEETLKKYLHPQVELSWYGTTGLKKLNFDEIRVLSLGMGSSYDSLRADVEKILAEGDDVAVHFSYYARTIENPEEEIPLAHFLAIWEIRDDKLYRGLQISQLGEEVESTPWSS